MSVTRKMLAMASLVGVMGLILAGNVAASTNWYHWSTVGTNPLWISANGQKGVANPEEFIKMMTSSKGHECARRSGIPAKVWAAAIDKVKNGQYTRKGMPSGSKFRSMCFGVSGVGVIPNVQWSGNGPLGGREIIVTVDGVRYHIFVPDGCANVVWWTEQAPRPAPTPAPRPAVGKGPITITKSCEDADLHQLVGGCPTNTFRFKITTRGNSQTITYNPAPGSIAMRAGRCIVGKLVTARELFVSGWKVADGVKNPQVLTCTRKGVRFVFKNMETAVVVPTGPVTISKSCIDAVDHQLTGGCPTNTFKFVVTPEGLAASTITYNPAPGTTDVPAGRCVIGKNVKTDEQPTTGWTAAPGTSVSQTLLCTNTGARFVFKNMETTAPPAPTKSLTCDSVSRVVGDRTVNISDVGWTSSGYTVDHVNIGWGDGASDNKAASHPVAGSHAYAYGSYTVVVKIVASDGTTATSASCSFSVSWTAPAPPPTLAVNQPPSVVFENMPLHIFSRGQAQICVDATDPEGDNLAVSFSASLGTTSSVYQPDPFGSPQKWCVLYTAPRNNGPGDITEFLSATVNDGHGHSVSTPPGSFPIKPEGF